MFLKENIMEHRWNFSLHGNSKDLVAEERKGPLATPCWEVVSHKWPSPGSTTHSSNRLIIHYRGKRMTMARAIYTHEIGDIPTGKIIRHRCDNPMCANPDHLLFGTYADNTHDMLKRDRHKHGEKTSWSKLSINAVRFIRELKYKPGIFATLGLILDVSEVTIRDVYYGRTWKYDE